MCCLGLKMYKILFKLCSNNKTVTSIENRLKTKRKLHKKNYKLINCYLSHLKLRIFFPKTLYRKLQNIWLYMAHNCRCNKEEVDVKDKILYSE